MNTKTQFKSSGPIIRSLSICFIYYIIFTILAFSLDIFLTKYFDTEIGLYVIINFIYFIYFMIILILSKEGCYVDFNTRKITSLESGKILNFDDLLVYSFKKSNLYGFEVTFLDKNFKPRSPRDSQTFYAYSSYSNKEYNIFKREFFRRAKTDFKNNARKKSRIENIIAPSVAEFTKNNK